MASSLPVGADGRTPFKPVKGHLNTTSSTDVVNFLQISEETPRSRKRATTVDDSEIPRGLLDRRFNQQHAPPSLSHLKIEPGKPTKNYQPHAPNALPVDVSRDRRSAPIAIPTCQTRSSKPTTPLTGRVPPFKFLPFPKQPHASPTYTHSNKRGFTPSPDSQYCSLSESSQRSHSPITGGTMKPDRAEPSPTYIPSVLSPTMLAHSTSPLTPLATRTQSNEQQDHSRPSPLTFPKLPPLHPANFESRTSSPRNTSHSGTAAHNRQTSDAQRTLQRYQRDIVLSATRTALVNTKKSPLARPSSPRLDPLGSPGPVTPLLLGGQDDYFLAGSGAASRSKLKESERRDLADRLIAAERDRLSHPERFERHSPAVSPAGGHG